MTESPCSGLSSSCQYHFHAEDPIYRSNGPKSHVQDNQEAPVNVGPADEKKQKKEEEQQTHRQSHEKVSFRMIIRNFTPSWFIITISTGVLSILLHQIPYLAHWLDIVADIVFVLNIVLFLIFTFVSSLRYILYPSIFPAVLRHPHQSLFLATFPIALATLINMIVLVCVPAWGHGMATFAWILWWIDSVLALIACVHLTWNIMSNQRSELEELTALYLLPIVAIVISATSGGLVASVLTNERHRLWTLVISYVFWGLGTPLSWIILTIYFLRMTVHKPLKREVVVSLLLPIGPLGLSGFSLILLGKVARHSFTVSGVIPIVAHAGDMFYLMGLLVGIILWGFAVVWFIVAVMMILKAYPFPFNMGWWGFVFPICIFTLLTISIGEEFNFKFFKILSCVLTSACVVLWLLVAVRTVKRAANGKMFFAPCLGTDLFLKRRQAHDEERQRL